MNEANNKLSLRQAMVMFIVLFLSPAIRYIPMYSIKNGGNGSIFAPLIALPVVIFYFYMMYKFTKSYEGISYIDIMKDILGKPIGVILGVVYFLFFTLFSAYNLRMFSQRLVSTTMANSNIMLISIVMLLVVIYVLRHKLVILARMSEFFFLLFLVIFLSFNIIMIPQLDLENFLPLSYKDILPGFHASLSVITIVGYFMILPIINDKINGIKDYKNLSSKVIFTIIVSSILVIVMPLGIFGESLINKMSIPYINAVMQASLFNTFNRLESLFISVWIISDFVMIAIFIYSALHCLEKIFKTNTKKYFVTMYGIGILLLSSFLSMSDFDLLRISEYFLTPLILVTNIFLPIIVFIIAVIRKKITFKKLKLSFH